MYKLLFKRVFGFLFSLLALLVLSPILVVVIILIKIDSKGPVFYTQNRIGQGGKVFQLLKFRSMTNKKRDPNKAQTYKDDPEITSVGYYLRRFKIDELPQLINVLKGDMSIVGPRPALPELYEQYGEQAKVRLAVRPGLTGLSQINGNIYLPWEERFVYDAKYIDSLSFWGDVRIIIKTVLIVLFGEEKFIKK